VVPPRRDGGRRGDHPAGRDGLIRSGAPAPPDSWTAATSSPALEAAGGEIVRLGMPVDPGNLLMLGRPAIAP